MHEAALWREVEKQRVVPDELKEYLRERGYVEDAYLQDSEDAAVGIIIREIDAINAAATGGRKRQSRDEEGDIEEVGSLDVGLGDSENALILSKGRAAEAIRSPEVQELRSALSGPGGRMPTTHQARRLLAFSRLLQKKLKDPNHRARLIPDVMDIAEGRKRLFELFLEALGALDGEPEGEKAFRLSRRWLVVAAALSSVAENLAEQYDWNTEDAAWLVLTGEAPLLAPVRVSAHVVNKSKTASRAQRPLPNKISLEVQPWALPEEVEKAYRKARQITLGESKRPASSRRLEVLRFVQEHTDRHGKRPPDTRLYRLWNQAYPDWNYPSYRSFAKARREMQEQLESSGLPKCVIGPRKSLTFQPNLGYSRD